MKTHLGYVLLIAAILAFSWLSFSAWRTEHDRALLAEQQIKVGEAEVKGLKEQMADRARATAETVAALRRRASEVKTPEQAIAAIPQVSDLPLNLRPAVDNPGQVSVDVVTLFRGLSQCRQDSVELASCALDRDNLGKQLGEKDKIIAALKAKPKFWKRVWQYSKIAGGFTAVGIAIGTGVL